MSKLKYEAKESLKGLVFSVAIMLVLHLCKDIVSKAVDATNQNTIPANQTPNSNEPISDNSTENKTENE